MTRRNENRPGYNKTKVGWIPEEWKCVRLEDVADVRFSNVDKKSHKGEQAVRLCNYTDVYYNAHITDAISFMSATATPREIERYSLQKGDVLITKDSETADDIAVPSLVDRDFVDVICGYHLALIRPRKKRLIGGYLAETLRLPWTRHYFFTLANGVTRYGLTTPATLNAQIPIPSLPEQKKIAEILSAWDRAIDQVGKLIDAKQRLKKGLMQQLLSGRIRFPEFGKPVEKRGELPEGWSIKPISSIAQISFSGVDKKTHTDEIPVRLCNYMDVYANDYITADLNFMPATASDSEIERFSLQQGDVMITKDSETPDDIGIPAVVTEKLENVVCGYHLALIRPNAGEVDPRFLSKELGSAKSRKHFSTHANGATRFGLTTSTVMKTTVHLPPTDEQKRIAGTLLACDTEIQLLTRKHDLFQEQKKGLMQRLLTGEIRVKI